MTARPRLQSSLAAKRTIASSLLRLEQHLGFTLARIFKEWRRVCRENRKTGIAGVGTSVREAVMLLRRRFAEIFDNYAEAFVFLDVNTSGDLSPEEFKRGLWRLNLHEIWRCPMGPSCCRYDCSYQPPSGSLDKIRAIVCYRGGEGGEGASTCDRDVGHQHVTGM